MGGHLSVPEAAAPGVGFAVEEKKRKEEGKEGNGDQKKVGKEISGDGEETAARKRVSSATRVFFEGGNAKEGNNTKSEDTNGEYRRVTRDYTLDKLLGEGHYGVVRLGENRKTKVKVAIKSILKKKVKRVEVLKREVDIMLKLDHPNIIKLIDVYEDEQYLHLVMELCTGGELFDRIIKNGSLSEPQAAQIMKQILDALAYCHKQHIAHRDLKPENFIFLTDAPDSPLKIIDFGLANFFEMDKEKYMKTRVGTPFYLAPEVLERHFDEKCDLWSAGVILYILLCGYPPFYGASDKEIFSSIRLGRFSFPPEEWSGISENAKKLIRSLLARDPESRPSAEEAMKHPWFQTMLQPATKTTPAPKTKEPAISKLPVTAIESLKKFAALSKLKRKAFGLISKQLSADEIKELAEHFKSIDQDQNKVITPMELMEAIGMNATTEEVKTIFSALDEDGDGVINYEEFLNAAAVRRESLKEERIKKAFDIFDKHGTGVVTVHQFEEALGVQDDPKIVAEILASVNAPRDGTVSLEDFKNLLTL